MNPLGYKMQEHEDFYKSLGCSMLSNTEQILTEYRRKVISCHPDKNPDDVEAKERFELLQLAKDTLTDEKLREKYDGWINSGACMPWKDWLRHSQNHQMVFHWVFKKPDAMIEASQAEATQPIAASTSSTSSNSSRWAYGETSSNELLKKFRNYEI